MDTQPGGGKLGKTSLQMEPQLAALLSYALGLVTGLVFYLLEKENRFVRFHALQSCGLSIILIVVSSVAGLIPTVGMTLNLLVNLGGLAIWVVCMVKAYQGDWFRLPVIGDIAAGMVGGPS